MNTGTYRDSEVHSPQPLRDHAAGPANQQWQGPRRRRSLARLLRSEAFCQNQV